MTDREIFKLALDCLENAVDLQQSEIDMHILHYGEWYRPQRVEFMKKYLNKTNQSIEAIRSRLAQPEQEPNPWRFAAQRLGEDLSTVGPDGYYNMSAFEWLDWAMKHITPARIEQEPVAWLTVKETWGIPKMVVSETKKDGWKPVYTAPPQREWCQCKDAPNDCTYEKNCRVPQIDAAFKRIEWQGLTDEEVADVGLFHAVVDAECVRAIEAKLKEKNS